MEQLYPPGENLWLIKKKRKLKELGKSCLENLSSLSVFYHMHSYLGKWHNNQTSLSGTFVVHHCFFNICLKHNALYSRVKSDALKDKLREPYTAYSLIFLKFSCWKNAICYINENLHVLIATWNIFVSEWNHCTSVFKDSHKKKLIVSNWTASSVKCEY